jgi:hypothetical protein
MISGAVHRSSGIYFMVEENSGKCQLGDCLTKAVRPFIVSNGIPYLEITSIGSHSRPGRENKRKGYGMSIIKKWAHNLFFMGQS